MSKAWDSHNCKQLIVAQNRFINMISSFVYNFFPNKIFTSNIKHDVNSLMFLDTGVYYLK